MPKTKQHKDAQIRIVPVYAAENAVEAIKASFAASGPDLFKRPEIRAKLSWRDTNGHTVAGKLANSGIREIQMAFASDAEILKITNSHYVPLSTFLMFVGDQEIRAKVMEAKNADNGDTG